jgi:hypothetical protein
MALTRNFNVTVQARVRRDAVFREALAKAFIELFLAGELQTAEAIRRDYLEVAAR